MSTGTVPRRNLELKVLARQHEVVQGVSRSFRNLRRREPVDVRDSADASDATYRQDLELRLAEIMSREARQLEKAVEAIESEEYGICHKCREEISAKRLEAIPSATLCTSCQTEAEEDAS